MGMQRRFSGQCEHLNFVTQHSPCAPPPPIVARGTHEPPLTTCKRDTGKFVESGCMESSAKLKVCTAIMESAWNLWMWQGGVVSMRQVWLVKVGGTYGCC